MSDATTSTRRGFLGTAAAALGGVILRPGIQLIEIARAAAPTARGEPSKVRWGMLIDTTKCAAAAPIASTPATPRTAWRRERDPPIAQWIRKIEIKDDARPVAARRCR